jgi:hypothetical protein
MLGMTVVVSKGKIDRVLGVPLVQSTISHLTRYRAQFLLQSTMQVRTTPNPSISVDSEEAKSAWGLIACELELHAISTCFCICRHPFKFDYDDEFGR